MKFLFLIILFGATACSHTGFYKKNNNPNRSAASDYKVGSLEEHGVSAKLYEVKEQHEINNEGSIQDERVWVHFIINSNVFNENNQTMKIVNANLNILSSEGNLISTLPFSQESLVSSPHKKSSFYKHFSTSEEKELLHILKSNDYSVVFSADFDDGKTLRSEPKAFKVKYIKRNTLPSHRGFINTEDLRFKVIRMRIFDDSVWVHFLFENHHKSKSYKVSGTRISIYDSNMKFVREFDLQYGIYINPEDSSNSIGKHFSGQEKTALETYLKNGSYSFNISVLANGNRIESKMQPLVLK